MHSSLIGCIKCNHKDVWKYGFYRYRGKKFQVYKCRQCNTSFTKLSKSKYVRHRFDKRIIVFAITLYRFGLSGPVISKIIRNRFRVKVSDWTICLWFRKFGNCAREMLRKMGIHFSKIWHGDEMWIKAKNKWFYLYIIIDSNNNLIAMHVSPHRDKKSAIAVLRKARQVAGKPDIIVTDEWNGYSGAIRKVFGRRKPKVKHVQAHFAKKLVLHNQRWYSLSNNRIEGWNSWFRPMYRRMRGFKSILSMNKFMDMFTLLYNLRDNLWDFLVSW